MPSVVLIVYVPPPVRLYTVNEFAEVGLAVALYEVVVPVEVTVKPLDPKGALFAGVIVITAIPLVAPGQIVLLKGIERAPAFVCTRVNLTESWQPWKDVYFKW